MSFISVEHLKYRYPHGKRLALDGLDFQVEKGEFIGIAGANQAGKSTLCQALAGLVPNMFKGAYGGRVWVDGLETEAVPVARLCKKVGLVFQNPFNQLSGAKDTVFEEVAFGLQNLGVPASEIRRRVEEKLRLLEIEGYRDRNPFDLSGGQIQRVALAGILAMEPDVLVLDEPTSQLDPQGSDEVFQVVEKLAHSGITIFMAEHKVEKLASYCDKILLLHEGKQIAFDTPERIFSRDDLEIFGMEAPVFTRVSRSFGVTLGYLKDQTSGLLYPVTEEETKALREQFPKETLKILEKSTGEMKEPHKGEENTGAIGRQEESQKEDAVFALDQVSFSYTADTPVLQGLDLTLDTRPTAIVGQNGAGKTTLIKLLKGLLKPQSGRILFQETDLAKKTVAELAGSIGYVFQNPDDQIFKNRVLDEVMVGPLNIGMDREKALRHAEEALKTVGLWEVRDENPYDLDLSERKLTAIASVLAMDTRVLILDEPTIAQDVRGRRCIGEIVRRLRSQKKAVIAVLHDMDFAAKYFERIIVMAHGRVLADGDGRKVFYDACALKEARLEQPHVTALCAGLGFLGRYLTVEDMEILKEEGR